MGDIRVCEQGCSIRLQDLEDAIVRRVPPSPKEPWQLETFPRRETGTPQGSTGFINY